LRNDTEHKLQEVTRTIGGISDAVNERIDAHVVATRKMTDRISQEMNARSGRLLDDMKEHRTETEASLKEFRQNYSLFREQVNSGQADWQNKAGGEIDKVNDNVRLVKERVARLVEDMVTEIQVAAQNSIEKVNTEITYLR
jgi:outer membrane murein-binding lipoprotein Lpp